MSTLLAEKVTEGSHTPGPWHWDSDPVKNDPTGRIRYRICATGKTITQVYYSSFEGGLTNAKADAKLIAAAPDMLKLLKELIDLEGPQPGHVMWMHDVEDVIAKVEGK